MFGYVPFKTDSLNIWLGNTGFCAFAIPSEVKECEPIFLYCQSLYVFNKNKSPKCNKSQPDTA